MSRINHGVMSSDRDDWETPRELFDRCDAIWHFDLDVASSDDNALCERHFTKETDGLDMSWGGGHRSWCNPPYGREIGRWVEKCATESRKPGTVVVALVPARTDTRWWWDWVVPYAAEVRFLRGRVRFGIGGVPQQGAPFPSALVRWGGELPETSRGDGDGQEGAHPGHVRRVRQEAIECPSARDAEGEV